MRERASAISSPTLVTGRVALAKSAKGAMATVDTGARSFSGSNESFWYSAGLMTSAGPMSNNTWPSGGALITASMAMLPPAPGRFSSTNGWPNDGVTLSVIVRVMPSATPPAPRPMMMRTGFCGYWACASVAAPMRASAASLMRTA